jgi:phage gp46-like protein
VCRVRVFEDRRARSFRGWWTHAHCARLSSRLVQMSGPGPKRETVVDLAKFIDKGVLVKLSGGREGTCTRVQAGPGLLVLTTPLSRVCLQCRAA